jgi:phage-related protein (TIGR01555 family)
MIKANPFKLPKPAPGVMPEASKIAMDAAMAPTFSYANQYDAYSEGLVFLGYPVLAQMAQRTEYRRPSEILAKEMTRKWIKVVSAGDDDKTEKVAAIEAELKRLNAQRCFREALEQDGFFGRSQIFLDMGDEDLTELKLPLSDKNTKVSKSKPLKALTVVEPTWTYPNQYNTDNPLRQDFYKPSSWFVYGTEVHASRMLTFVSREVPDMLKPAYAFGGLSLTQLLKPYVDNWLSTRQAVNDLVRMFSTSVLKTNLDQLITPQGADGGILNRVQGFNLMRNNQGTFVVDKNNEDFANVSTPLGTLDALQAQAQEHQSSACGIPLVKLFGITPKGLNGSTDGEIQAFYEWLESLQEGISPHVKRLLDVIQLSLFDAIDDGITFVWQPLKHLDEVQDATVQKTQADTDAVYIEAGVITPEEVRTRLAGDEEGPYHGLDLSIEIEPPEADDPSSNGNAPEDDA